MLLVVFMGFCGSGCWGQPRANRFISQDEQGWQRLAQETGGQRGVAMGRENDDSVYDKITLDCLWDIEMVASSRPLGTCVWSLIKGCEMQRQRPQC